MLDEHIVLVELRGNRPVRREWITGDKGRIIRQPPPQCRRKLVQSAEGDRAVGDVDIGGTEPAFTVPLLGKQPPVRTIGHEPGQPLTTLPAFGPPLLVSPAPLLYRTPKTVHHCT